MSHTRIQPVMSRPGENAMFIVLGINQNQGCVNTIIDFAANFSALTRSLNNRYPESHLMRLWDLAVMHGTDYFQRNLYPENWSHLKK